MFIYSTENPSKLKIEDAFCTIICCLICSLINETSTLSQNSFFAFPRLVIFSNVVIFLLSFLEEYENNIKKATFGEAIWATEGLENFFAGLISVGELVIARKIGRARK